MTLNVFQNQRSFNNGTRLIGTVDILDTPITKELLEIVFDLCNYDCNGCKKIYHNDKPSYVRKGIIFTPTSYAKGYCNADIFVMNGAEIHVALPKGWHCTEDLEVAMHLTLGSQTSHLD